MFATGRRVEARSVAEAELIGAWIDVSVVHEHFESLSVSFWRGDSIVLINDIKRRGSDSQAHSLLMDIWYLPGLLHGWEARHVNTVGNK